MKYHIVIFGDPVLRVRATPVAAVNAGLKRLVDDMFETMHNHRGLGLAAQQIGQTISVCVIDVPPHMDVAAPDGPRLNPEVPMPLVLFNPEIVERARTQEKREEGCLSFPGIAAPVSRAAEVTVTYLDLKGDRRSLRARGLLARALQHELDHLQGVLLVDRMPAVKRISLAGQLRRLQATSRARSG